MHSSAAFFFCFFNDTATTEIYTLSLHALFRSQRYLRASETVLILQGPPGTGKTRLVRSILGAISHRKGDRKSTRLNSSHLGISYAVFCLKKKKKKQKKTKT